MACTPSPQILAYCLAPLSAGFSNILELGVYNEEQIINWIIGCNYCIGRVSVDNIQTRLKTGVRSCILHSVQILARSAFRSSLPIRYELQTKLSLSHQVSKAIRCNQPANLISDISAHLLCDLPNVQFIQQGQGVLPHLSDWLI